MTSRLPDAETYIEDGEERYSDGSGLVWPSRSKAFDLSNDLIVRLAGLEAETRPSGGETTAKNKDQAAMQALHCAAMLVQQLAGWAIDHQLGLAIKGLQHVSSAPETLKGDDAYQAALGAVDDHRHEKVGARFARLSGATARRGMLNVLRPMWQDLHLPGSMIDALDALDFGELQPIAETVSASRKVGLRELRCKLEAIAFIEYESCKKRRMSLEDSRQLVADEFRYITAEAVRKWDKEVRKGLDKLVVERKLERSRKGAANFEAELVKEADGDSRASARREWCERDFGTASLKKAAAIWKQLRAGKKQPRRKQSKVGK